MMGTIASYGLALPCAIAVACGGGATSAQPPTPTTTSAGVQTTPPTSTPAAPKAAPDEPAPITPVCTATDPLVVHAISRAQTPMDICAAVHSVLPKLVGDPKALGPASMFAVYVTLDALDIGSTAIKCRMSVIVQASNKMIALATMDGSVKVPPQPSAATIQGVSRGCVDSVTQSLLASVVPKMKKHVRELPKAIP